MHTNQNHNGSTPTLGITANPADAEPLARATGLAERLGLPLIPAPEPGTPKQAKHAPDARPTYDLLLEVTQRGLQLRALTGDADLTHGHPLLIDWSAIDTGSAQGRSLDQPILKAVGLKSRSNAPRVIDPTGGLGEDGYLLARMGCKVTLVERNPIVHALLEDALARAIMRGLLRPGEMTLHLAEARDWLNPAQVEGQAADVVYLDPMFPTGRKTRERKPMRLVRLLAGDDADAPELLDRALGTGVGRVVVKRPLHAAPITGPTPHHAIKGKSLRFDVYLQHVATPKT